MSCRVAAIDCGTNSLRLLIAERAPNGLTDVCRQMRIVRLGQAVDKTGRLHPDALARTEVVLADYAAAIAGAGADPVRMVATSAVRDAGNRKDFDSMVRRVLGRAADVVSGQEEAALSFAGACSALPGQIAQVLVTDIGGGSTELVSGERASGRVDIAASIDIGSVRLTERFVRSDPMSASAQAAIRAQVVSALDLAALGTPPERQLVGVAGTVTTVAALALGLGDDDPAHVDAVTVARADIDRVVRDLVASTRTQRQASGVIHPGRVDVIAAGALILQELMHHLDARDLIVTQHDILDGIALGLLA